MKIMQNKYDKIIYDILDDIKMENFDILRIFE